MQHQPLIRRVRAFYRLSPRKDFIMQGDSEDAVEALWRNEERLEVEGLAAQQFAEVHGLLMRRRIDAPADALASPHAPLTLCEHVPFTILPARVPAKEYERVRKCAPLFNLLCDRISRHESALESMLSSYAYYLKRISALDFLNDYGRVAASDEFTGRLMNLYRTVTKEGSSQPLALGILRSDYMLSPSSDDFGSFQFKQVELNTIAAAFGHLSSGVEKMHRFLLHRCRPDISSLIQYPEQLNEAGKGIASGLASACKAVDRNVVMMVVQPGELNSIDQLGLEYALFYNDGIVMVRYSLGDVAARGRLDPKTNDLIVDNHIIGVAYFRAGYTPRDYPTESEWDARLLIERSRAVKCPNIAYHLVGTKKVQQCLCLPGVVEQFMESFDDAQTLRSVFARQWSMDVQDSPRDEIDQLIAQVSASPDEYVMKPQREGGGNNFYGADVITQLSRMSDTEKAAYVLMERLRPPACKSAFLKRGAVVRHNETLSEIGIYGVFLGSGSEVLVNEAVGYLVRTKKLGVNEGGVATGYAVLDSLMLI